MAGGFLTKTKQDVLDGKGRFDTSTPAGKMYNDMYARPSILQSLELWDAASKEEGCSKAELAYRWVAHDSAVRAEYGDAIIIGASRAEQITQTMQGLRKGKIGEKAMKMIEEVWEKVRDEAPLDNMSR